FKEAKLSNLTPAETNPALQRLQLDLLRNSNRRHLEQTGFDARLDARLDAYELAFRMQMEAPRVLDFSGESKATRSLYGIDEEPTDEFGRQCLVARRLSEHGVRFVQVAYSYPRNYWDAHSNLKNNHTNNAKKVDKPIAGLLKD